MDHPLQGKLCNYTILNNDYSKHFFLALKNIYTDTDISAISQRQLIISANLKNLQYITAY